MTTMRAVRCQVCQMPTGEFFDADVNYAPSNAHCRNCQPVDQRPGAPPVPQDAEPDEEDHRPLRECPNCGSLEFRFTEVFASYVNTRDSGILEGDTIFFPMPEPEDGSAEATCYQCGTPAQGYDVG